MELIKLVIKLGNHLLDILGFLLLVQLVDNCLLDVLLGVARDNCTLRANYKLRCDLRSNWLFLQNLVDGSVFIML